MLRTAAGMLKEIENYLQKAKVRVPKGSIN
jgi:hypothetical protein